MPRSSKVITYNGSEIHIPSMDGMFNLTELWKAVGSPAEKKPAHWAQQDRVSEYIEDTAKSLNVRPDHIYRASRGRGGSTWAIWEIAGAYAEHLDHALHREILNVYRRVKENFLTRHKRIETRKDYCSTLASHDVSGGGFAICTDAGYLSFWGLTAKQLRARHNIKGSIRDTMRPSMQAATTLYEELAAEEIEELNLRGTQPCAESTGRNAHHVKNAVIEARRSRQSQLPFK